MHRFRYQLPVPDGCKQYPQITFEDNRILDPADCQPQLDRLRKITERLCATPSCNVPLEDITILISDNDQINGSVVTYENGKHVIFVTRGALLKTESEDEVAFLVAHELGHPELRKRYGSHDKSKEIPGRINETGADGWGAIFLTEAGYNWKAAETLIKRFPKSEKYLHVLDAHGRRTDRIKTIYDVLGAHGLINQTELSEENETPVPPEFHDGNFIAAKHTSFIETYKAHVSWDGLNAIERFDALLRLSVDELKSGIHRATECLGLIRATANLARDQAHPVSDEVLHESARTAVQLFSLEPFRGHYDYDWKWHEHPAWRNYVGIYSSLAHLRAAEPKHMLFLPALGPFHDMAQAMRGFMQATTDDEVLAATAGLVAIRKDFQEKYPATVLFRKFASVDLPHFEYDGSDPQNYPWRKYDGVIKRTQSIELLQALAIMGTTNDKVLWENTEYPLLSRFYNEFTTENHFIDIPTYSHPRVAGYQPYETGGTLGRPDDMLGYDRFGGQWFNFGEYAAERLVKERPRARNWEEFTIDEIEADPWPFVIAFRDDVEFLNNHIEENRSVWPSDKLWAEHVRRSNALIGKVSAHIAAHPDKANFWRDMFKGDAYDEQRRICSGFGGDSFPDILASDVTARKKEKKRRAKDEWWLRDEREEQKGPKQLWLFEGLTKHKPMWLTRREQEPGFVDTEEEREEYSDFPKNSPITLFVADDPLGLFTAGDKTRVFREMKMEAYGSDEEGGSDLRWMRKKLGYEAVRTPDDYVKLAEHLSIDPVKPGERIETWGSLYFEETIKFLDQWEAPAFSPQTWKVIGTFDRSFWANGDNIEYRTHDKLRYKVARELEKDTDHIQSCPDTPLIKLNNYYEDNNFYPSKGIWDLAAQEIVKRIDRTEGARRYNLALLALKNSMHPKVQTLARSVWVATQSQRLGADDNSNNYRQRFRRVMTKLNRQGLPWEIQYELVKELARVTCIQPETAKLCEEHFEEKVRKSLNSLGSDIGMRTLGLLTEATEKKPKLRKTAVEFLAKDYDEAEATRLAKRIISAIGSRRALDAVGFYGNVRLSPKFVQSCLVGRLRTFHHTLWELPVEWRAGAFSQLLITGDEISKDAPAAWNNGIQIVTDLLFPKRRDADETDAKWTRWYRLGTRFYIESAHPTERSLLLAIMLGVAKQSPNNGHIDNLEGAKRFAQLLNSFDPAHRKLSQSIASHPDIPLLYAEPFQSATYMAQEPARWITLKHQQYVLPEAVKKEIKWYGPLLGFASFYMTHGVTIDGEERVTSVLHRNAREAAEKGFKRLDYTIRRLAEAEPSFRVYLPIALDTIQQARELATRETDIEYGRLQLGWMTEAMNGQSTVVDGGVYTRQVVPWLQSGDEGKRGAYKVMPWVKGLRLDQITDEAERTRVASSEVVMTLANVAGGVYDTDGHTGNRLIEGNITHVYDVGGMVREDRGPAELMRLFSIATQLTDTLPQDTNPSRVILDAIQEEEKTTGERPADLVRLNKTMISMGGWLRTVSSARLPSLIGQALG